ncbi:MAG TPA: hypothetical protein VK879_00245 [Candidatus Sulfomarinibacteraceae bacterium]|nr:hypothetical protein [Candidatus Sulfomarinibacteraceae bacterium]
MSSRNPLQAISTISQSVAARRYIVRLFAPLFLALVIIAATVGSSTAAPTTQIPTIMIVAVERDETVTVRTNNFPANRTFTARIGPMGTRGVNGTVVATTNSGAGGTFDVTYEIPDALHGARQLSIRLEAPGGYYAFNWFYNTNTGAATPPPATPTPDGTRTSTIPTFNIVSVQRDQSVTIRTANFPANRAFTARIGPMGTRGINGTVVGTTNSGAGGTFDVTYEIPSNLRGARQLSIRLEAPGGYYAYNWFYNNTTQ